MVPSSKARDHLSIRLTCTRPRLGDGRGLALFAEEDVLASHRIELHQFEALTSVRLVLRRPVLEAGSSGRAELDDWSLVA